MLSFLHLHVANGYFQIIPEEIVAELKSLRLLALGWQIWDVRYVGDGESRLVEWSERKAKLLSGSDFSLPNQNENARWLIRHAFDW